MVDDLCTTGLSSSSATHSFANLHQRTSTSDATLSTEGICSTTVDLSLTSVKVIYKVVISLTSAKERFETLSTKGICSITIDLSASLTSVGECSQVMKLLGYLFYQNRPIADRQRTFTSHAAFSTKGICSKYQSRLIANLGQRHLQVYVTLSTKGICSTKVDLSLSHKHRFAYQLCRATRHNQG